MDRVSMKAACFLVLFMAASLLPSCLTAEISGSKISASEIGHSVGFGSTLGVVSKTENKKKKPKPAGKCGKCETSDDCRGCPAPADCEKIILNGFCA